MKVYQKTLNSNINLHTAIRSMFLTGITRSSWTYLNGQDMNYPNGQCLVFNSNMNYYYNTELHEHATVH